ncbi:MAG: hypothetical protein JWO62_587 [Acidimicrobiaceae bacterium]|nr:hypothetical protein [Acidimicrobiaceae bacterium]
MDDIATKVKDAKDSIDIAHGWLTGALASDDPVTQLHGFGAAGDAFRSAAQLALELSDVAGARLAEVPGAGLLP